jgi:curved DNA-binding protein CbpA
VLHPDSSHPSASAEHFATLNRAYKLLSVQQSRTSYLQTGYGWSGPTDAEDPHASADAAMRSWARHARAHGAASWEAGARARGFRASEGGAGYYHTHPGEDFPFHDAPPKGNGDVIFMSNGAFVAFIAGLAGVGTFIQYYRMGAAVDDTKALLVDRHLQ